MQVRQVMWGLLWSGFATLCVASPLSNTTMAVESGPQALGPTPECASLKTSPMDDPRWNTQSPGIQEPRCKGTWWRFWPAINWDIQIPNDHIFDASAIAANEHDCGSSVYNLVPWTTLKTWIGCDMQGTTGVLKFRTITSTEVSTISEALNEGTCHAMSYVNCIKERGSWT